MKKPFPGLMLLVLALMLAACSRPQQASSGKDSGARATFTPGAATGTPGSQTPAGYAGRAVLNLERYATFHYTAGGDDFQRETGTIELKFSESTEGHLIVEGSGKTAWTEDSTIPNCSFKAQAEGAITVTGLYNVEECKFNLTIQDTLSQPTTQGGSALCSGSITLNDPVSISIVELYPPYSNYKESKQEGWWQVSTVKVTDINSSTVTGCLVFTPEVIQKSTQE